MDSKCKCRDCISKKDGNGCDNKCFCSELECARFESNNRNREGCFIGERIAADGNCTNNVSEILSQEGGCDCKEPGNGDFMNGEDAREIINGDKTEEVVCKDNAEKSGAKSCCGGTGQDGSCGKSNLEEKSSANYGKQSTTVELDRGSVSEVGVDSHTKVEGDLGCCSQEVNAHPVSEMEGDLKGKEKKCGALGYGESENASDLVDDSNFEKKSLLFRTKDKKRDKNSLPINQLSGIGIYGSTVKCDATTEKTVYFQAQIPGPAKEVAPKVTISSIEIEPFVKTTKFRIQNICCGKEADMVKRELEPHSGIMAVSVNIVGRVGFVKHDENVVSASDIVNILNKLHLGVSIMESSDNEDEQILRREVMVRLGAKSAVLAFLTALFVLVLVARTRGYNWLKWVAIAEIVVGVVPIIRKIIINLMKKVFIDINMLMLIAVAGTVSLQEWIEGATLVFVFAIAEVLQQYCGYKVQCAISGIMVRLPDKAVLAETGKTVSIDEIEVGTRIIVCAGERIVLDGEVVKGQAAVDESSITGEAVPIEKGIGSQTYSGTIVQNGFLEILTTSTSKNSTISKVSQMVQEAQSKASHTEKMMNSFAKVYTPLVLITALLVFAIPAILAELKVGNYKSQLHSWGIRSLIVLLVACPCALLMSVPIPIVSGITTAAKNGTLVKSGTDMETLAKINSMAFDKTGTLTEGKFKVVNFRELDVNCNQDELLELVAALEVKSSHPVAAAIVNHYSGCITNKIAIAGTNVGLPDVADFKAVPGQGLKGTVCGHTVIVGNLKMLRQFSIDVSVEAERLFALWSDRGETVIFCSIDQQLSLMIGLADTPRATAKMTVQMLRNLGINSVILTGDCAGAAASVMIATGAENFIASMKPEEKLDWIRKAQQPSPKTRVRIAMIGDGINDGPSLAAADVGMAMGASATALAIESAGVALMSESLTRIPELLVLSRFTRLVVIQNIGIALAIKVAVVIATMFGSLALWMAVLSDVAGLLLVILNGIRPLFWRHEERVVLDELKETDGAAETDDLMQAGEWNEEGKGVFEIRL